MKLWKLQTSFTNFLDCFFILTIILLLTSENSLSKCQDPKNKEIKYLSPFNALFPNSTLEFYSPYEYAEGPCTNHVNCFLPYGICVNDTICMCMPEYGHIHVEGYSLKNLSCSYKRKKMVVAALLELFLPFGLGHFYVGHHWLGTFKLVYNFFIYTFCCVIYCKGSNYDSFADLMIYCVFLCCIIPLWNVIDIFLFFTGGYKDGYGIPLA